MYVVIEDPDQERAPTTLETTVGDAVGGETITFSIDGTDVVEAEANSNGDLFLFSVPVPTELTSTSGDLLAGTHTLTASGAGSASATFHLARNPAGSPTVRVPDVDPVEVMGRGTHWALQDPQPGGLGTWVMTPSPTGMSDPDVAKITQVDHSTHPINGQYYISVAENPPRPWSWSGYCPDQTFYGNLSAYCDLNRRLYVLDHRGRAWKAVLLRLDAKARKRQVNTDGTWQDWAHDYTVTAAIYDGPLVPV